MPRPQLVTAAGVLLIVVGANVALGGAVLSVWLHQAKPDACLCLACPFAVTVLLAGLGCLRVGWLVLTRPLPVGSVAAVASVAIGVGGLVAFVTGAFLANQLPRFVRDDRPRTLEGALAVGAVALAFCDGLALVVAGFLLAAGKRRPTDPPGSGPPPLPARDPPP